MPEQRVGHGWWPYIGPYLVFTLAGLAGERLPEAAAPAWLIVKPALVAACIFYFWNRGEYSELRGYRWTSPMLGADLAVGIALAALWVVPYLWIPAIRPGHFEEVLFRWGVPFLGAPEVDPGPVAGGFDAEMLGAALVPVAVALRMVGYGLVTPVFEELFMRSFVIRVAEVWGSDRDFRDVPIGFFSWKSFVAVIVIFTLAHLPWEYWVMVPWAILSTAWLYYRRHLMAVVVLHAATNASILIFVALASGAFPNGAGGRLSLWFFV